MTTTPPVYDFWPKVGEDVYYRRVQTTSTYDIGKVFTRPARPASPLTTQNQLTRAMHEGVWEIETQTGAVVTRKGWELQIVYRG